MKARTIGNFSQTTSNLSGGYCHGAGKDRKIPQDNDGYAESLLKVLCDRKTEMLGDTEVA
jgi:hypothetical protein